MQNKGFDLEWLDKLKSASDIVSVISQYVTLDKKGKTYWACCPFHFEKTPSFAVNEVEQYYHCFGCGESGDVIKFVQKIESLDFIDAVKNLAQKANMEVPAFTADEQLSEKKKQKEKLYKACNLAKEHYKKNLPFSEIAKNYLKKRELSAIEVEKFDIGYSSGWTSIIPDLNKQGINNYVMKDAGILEQKNDRFYDVMAERLIFPIINSYGDCIGFTARALDNQKFAKYRNTEQTPIFDKSKVVYNIFNIKKIKQERGLDEIIICEGAMDVIAMVKAGIENTVACMGTAITTFHGKELKRFAERIILCLDGDSAGQKATFKAIDILKAEGLDVRIAVLPESLDPDEFLKKYGAEKLQEYIVNAIDSTDYKLEILSQKFNLNNNFEKSKYLKEALKLISVISANAEREVYLKKIRDLTHVSVDVLRRDLLGNNTEIAEDAVAQKTLGVMEEGITKAIKFVLASLLHKKEYATQQLDFLYFKNPSHQKLFDFIKEKMQNNEVFSMADVFTIFDVDTETSIKDLINYDFSFAKDSERYYKESLEKIRRIGLEFKQEELKEQFKTETDIEKRRKIALELTSVTKELKK